MEFMKKTCHLLFCHICYFYLATSLFFFQSENRCQVEYVVPNFPFYALLKIHFLKKGKLPFKCWGLHMELGVRRSNKC